METAFTGSGESRRKKHTVPEPPALPLPGLRAADIVRFHDALLGGKWADAAQRDLAGEVGRRFPGHRTADPLPGGAAGEQVLAARLVHARAATWAVTKHTDRAAGVVAGFCGYPFDPDPHAFALTRAPHARFVYAAAAPEVAVVARGILGGDRVTTVTAMLRDPEGLMGLPQVRSLGGPIQLQAQLAAHWWPPELARELITAYADLLPAKSTLVLTLGIPAESDAGRQFTVMLSQVGGSPVYAHREEDVAGWITGAGLRLASRGVSAVRAHGRSWAGMLGRPWPADPGRIVYAVAAKP